MGLLWARALCETWSHRTPDAHTVLIGMRYHPSFGQRTIHSPLQQMSSHWHWPLRHLAVAEP